MNDVLESLDGVEASNYTHTESYMKDIWFEDTFTVFQDLNSLFFMYHEPSKTNVNNQNLSRRIAFKNFQRKTRRKRA